MIAGGHARRRPGSRGLGNQGMLFAIILLATILAQFIHKNAVAALMFPGGGGDRERARRPRRALRLRADLRLRAEFSLPRVPTRRTSWSMGPAATSSSTSPASAPLSLSPSQTLATILCPLVFPFRPNPLTGTPMERRSPDRHTRKGTTLRPPGQPSRPGTAPALPGRIRRLRGVVRQVRQGSFDPGDALAQGDYAIPESVEVGANSPLPASEDGGGADDDGGEARPRPRRWRRLRNS